MALALAATGTLWWWAGTDGSLATGLSWVQRFQPLTAENPTGSLRAGGHIDRLVWGQAGLLVEANDIFLAWQPWALLQGTLQLDRLAVGRLLLTDTRPALPTKPEQPRTLQLPLRIAAKAFSVDQFQLAGRQEITVSSLAGSYRFTGLQHQLDVGSVQFAGGNYQGRVALGAALPMALDAEVSGTLQATVPGQTTALALQLEASASGPLANLAVQANLRATPTAAGTSSRGESSSAGSGKKARPPPAMPQAQATARLQLWAAQPMPEVNASFQNLDIGALLPSLPHSMLTGSARVQPLGTALTTAGWGLQLQLTNALPGPWDRQQLPLDKLDAMGEWRSGGLLVRSLTARLGGGELTASGEWTQPAVTANLPSQSGTSGASQAAAPPLPAAGWKASARLTHINPALLQSQLAPLPVSGSLDVSSQGATSRFSANLQADADSNITNKRKVNSRQSPPAASASLAQLRLQDASAAGSWTATPGGGTLALSALRLRTSDAELSGQLELQLAGSRPHGGSGKLVLAAPGISALLDGELRASRGSGKASLSATDAGLALRWLRLLPGMPAVVNIASASGGLNAEAAWQGGWQDPAVQARIAAASLDLVVNPPAPTAPSTTAALATPLTNSALARSATLPAAASPAVQKPTALAVRIHGFNASLAGRLSQATLQAEGRADIGPRRFNLLLAADGGQRNAAGLASWQAVVRQFSLGLEDPALGSGAWRLASRGPVQLKWLPAASAGSSALDAGAGEATLTAPAAAGSAALPPALLAWQPVRWRGGELLTAGKLTGLPVAWLELLGGPQLAASGVMGGLGSSLVFDGQWDAKVGKTLALKASLGRSSGDLTLQAAGTQGSTGRVSAGIRQARLSLEAAGDALTLALVWDSERAGTANGQLATRLARTPDGAGLGWTWPEDAPLAGQLRAQLPRIGVWSLLAPPGWRLRGTLGTDIRISGSRSAPSLAGDLQADDLALRSVVDGIEFGNGRLRARLDGNRMRISEFSLQGAGDIGTGGRLVAEGEADWNNGKPSARLNARLQQLRASIRTDRQVTVSGNVQASLSGNQTSVDGNLAVDQARIVLPEDGTPQLGDDVVVRTAKGAAAGQKAPAQTTTASAAATDRSNRPLVLAVQIDLGPDFRIQGKGIDTRIRGVLALSSTSLSDPRLNGTVRTFGGQYRAYGQRLDVEQGLIRFTGPLDNPALDILAIRPNLTQRVGVQITGTALLPRVRLYAQPELPDAEKLSWLVVGRASAAGGAEAALLQQAALALLGSKSGGSSGGLAASLGLDELSFRGSSSNADGTAAGSAITLGKRFSRNFYAAYERSLSGALGTLFVFYDLSQRFTIRAQAGQQSAVDLIFTIPYD